MFRIHSPFRRTRRGATYGRSLRLVSTFFFPHLVASVNLREKPLSNGTLSLVLDYYDHGARRKQTLKIYVNPLHAKSRNAIERSAYDEAYRIQH